jgi:hypothetical protein
MLLDQQVGVGHNHQPDDGLDCPTGQRWHDEHHGPVDGTGNDEGFGSADLRHLAAVGDVDQPQRDGGKR